MQVGSLRADRVAPVFLINFDFFPFAVVSSLKYGLHIDQGAAGMPARRKKIITSYFFLSRFIFKI